MMLLMPEFIHFPRLKSENEKEGEGQGEGRKQVPKEWRAQYHMFYGRRCVDMDDGLDKWVDKKGGRRCDAHGTVIDEKKEE